MSNVTPPPSPGCLQAGFIGVGARGTRNDADARFCDSCGTAMA